MSNQYLKMRRSAVPGKIPTTSSLDFGELAINTYDGLAFIKKSGSNGEEIISIGSSGSSSSTSFIGNFTGSFSGSFTGSLQGTSSWSVNSISASYYNETDPVFRLVSASIVYTSSFNSFTSSYNTGSFRGTFTGSLLGTSSWSINALTSSYYNETDPVFRSVSSSIVYTSSFNSFTQSIHNFTSSYNTGSFTGSFTGSVIVDAVRFNTSSNFPLQPGTRRWNSEIGSTELRLGNNNVTLQDGQELHTYCKNDSGVNILNGQVVTLVGASGSYDRVQLAIASGSSLYEVYGVATEDIPTGSLGYVTSFGHIHDLNLSMFSTGSRVFLSQTTPGGLVTENQLDISGRTAEVGLVVNNSSTEGILRLQIHNEFSTANNTFGQLNVFTTNNTSTGIFSFTGLSANTTSSFNIGAVKGWVVDNETDPINPIVTYVTYAGISGSTTPYLNTSNITYVLLDATGSIVLQPSAPTASQRRTMIRLGGVAHPNGSISLVKALPDYSLSPISQLRDMFEPNPIINKGITPYNSGSSLGFKTTGGKLYSLGINYVNDNRNPNALSVTEKSPVTFVYRLQNGSGSLSPINVIDPSQYDNGGVLATVGGGSNSSTNQRIYVTVAGSIIVQYGQTVYSSLTEAISNVQTETFVTYPILEETAILIGILAVNKNATNLSDTSQARFLSVSKFGETIGASSGVSTATLQTAYNNSLNPEIITDLTHDGVQIRGGTGNDTHKNLIIENNSGSETGYILANGQATFSGVTSSLYGTASWSINALTASFVTASNVYGPHGSNSVLSASYTLTASYALNGGNGGSSTNFYYTGSAPSGSIPTGSVWIDSDDGFEYYYIFDGTSSVWFQPTVVQAVSYGVINTSNGIISASIPSDDFTINTVGIISASAVGSTITLTVNNPVNYTSSVLLSGSVSTIFQIATGSYTAGFFDYTINSGSNSRAGTIMAVWNFTSSQYTDNSTLDIGDTNSVTMSIDISSSFMRFRGASALYNWNVKTTYRLI